VSSFADTDLNFLGLGV